MLGPIEKQRHAETMFLHNTALGKRAEGKQIESSRLSSKRAANSRHDEIANSKIADAIAHGFDPRETFVAEDQVWLIRGQPRFFGEQNLSIGAADAELQGTAENFTGHGIPGRRGFDKPRL